MRNERRVPKIRCEMLLEEKIMEFEEKTSEISRWEGRVEQRNGWSVLMDDIYIEYRGGADGVS